MGAGQGLNLCQHRGRRGAGPENGPRNSLRSRQASLLGVGVLQRLAQQGHGNGGLGAKAIFRTQARQQQRARRCCCLFPGGGDLFQRQCPKPCSGR